MRGLVPCQAVFNMRFDPPKEDELLVHSMLSRLVQSKAIATIEVLLLMPILQHFLDMTSPGRRGNAQARAVDTLHA